MIEDKSTKVNTLWLEAPSPMKGPHPGGQQPQDSVLWSLVVVVLDSQGVLPPRGSGLVSDGRHGGTLHPHMLMKSWPIEEALRVATSTNKLEVEVFPHVAESSVGVLIGQKASCLCLPLRLNDCLTRHPCLWKFISRNSLSVPMQNSRGTTTVKLGAPWLVKEDRSTGRYFCKPSRVYKGTQSAVVVNWSGGHSMRRPSSRRIGSQCSVITSGRSSSDATAQGMKHSEVSMSLQEGMVLAFNPRRLHLTRWTQLVSAVKVSYLLEGCLPSSPL